MSKIRRRRHGKTRDGRLLWRMKTCFHLLVTKGHCGHHVRFKKDCCPTKQADEILANPDSDLATLGLVKCTRHKEFVRHPTVFMLQIVDPDVYEIQSRRPKRMFQVTGQNFWMIRRAANRRKSKAFNALSLDFEVIRTKMEGLGSRSSFPEFKWKRKLYKVRSMSIGNVRKYCRRVNRFKQKFALMLLKEKYGRSRL